MSKYARNSWKMSKRNGSSSFISSDETNKSSIEDDIPANPSVLPDVEAMESAELWNVLEIARPIGCADLENCKLCRSNLILVKIGGNIQYIDRKCYFEHFRFHFPVICEEFHRRGKCGFEQRTGRECSRRHERAPLYKKSVNIA
jgi:hypothetical protein